MRRSRGFRQTNPGSPTTVVWHLNVVIEERMANTASARKRIRQTVTRTARNQARKSRMRTFVKKVETAIAGGDKSAAAVALREAQPEMQRASGKGVIHSQHSGTQTVAPVRAHQGATKRLISEIRSIRAVDEFVPNEHG